MNDRCRLLFTFWRHYPINRAAYTKTRQFSKTPASFRTHTKSRSDLLKQLIAIKIGNFRVVNCRHSSNLNCGGVCPVSQQIKQLIADSTDCSGSQRQHQITWLNVVAQSFWSILKGSDVSNVLVAETFDCGRQRFGRCSFDWIFAGRINVSYKQGVSVIKRARKLLHQIVCAAVAVWLKQDHDSSSARANLCCCQSRLNFRRVVTVVIHHHHSA